MKRSQLLAAMLMAGATSAIIDRSPPMLRHKPRPEHLKAVLAEAQAKRDRKAARKGRA